MIARASLALLLTSLALPAAAQPRPPEPAPRQCFFKSQLNGWKEVGDRQLNVRASVRDVYVIDLQAPCWNLRWAQTIGLEARGSSSVCTGDLVTVVVPDRTTGPDRCFGRVARRLTPAEVAALPPKQRP